MEEKELNVMDRIATALEGNNQVLSKVCDVLVAVAKNQENVGKDIMAINGFAKDTFDKINEMTVQIDTISAVILEAKLVEPDRFRAMMSELYADQQKRIMEARAGKSPDKNQEEGEEDVKTEREESGTPVEE